jgi:hypothetical protein
LSDPKAAHRGEQKIGWLPGIDRGLRLRNYLVLRGLDELDLLAAVLLESGDDVPDRLVLLRVETFVPLHHEVGGLGAERRHRENRGENRNSAPHVVTPPIGRPASICSLRVPGNARANFDLGGSGPVEFPKSAWVRKLEA